MREVYVMKSETLKEITASYNELRTILEQEIEFEPQFTIMETDDSKAGKERGGAVQKAPSVVMRKGNEKDIIALMINNMSEIREYYVISKKQANDALTFAVFMSIMGLFIIFSAVITFLNIGTDLPISAFTAISGAIVELIAGTALIVYRRSLDQMNIYYNSLHQNEHFLSAVHLIGKISPDNRDAAYLEIIKSQCGQQANTVPANNSSGGQTGDGSSSMTGSSANPRPGAGN